MLDSNSTCEVSSFSNSSFFGWVFGNIVSFFGNSSILGWGFGKIVSSAIKLFDKNWPYYLALISIAI